jgi:hypothetical protein
VSDILLTPFREARLDERIPSPPARRRVYVDRDGRVVVGDGARDVERRRLSEIPPAVFA